ncbi:hypothetical protein J416_08142 [Gracilibacillus halophilus YIM-C55.5]|uniref:DUF4178 domain-containing protein n=1 Tax=Gracilibacillus halophilus YIM-C55.5 TaxID=1308866 RepID=N4WR89_9BACI|nr:DUF4178 domain-containing protein [Gracilibacillus halophilus]ENH96940.1 hypothetical protein J416_08142 [Gracilibacillus halophilus YIM-C55.5]
MGFFSKLFSKKEEKPEVQKRDILSIQVGDIIEYDLEDYEVVGKITYRQSSYEWISYQLLSAEQNILWLAAEMDDELELGIYKKIQLPDATKFPQELTYDGITYYQEESGIANVTGEGRSKRLNGEEVQYADYNDETSEHMISLEDWGGDVEASYGYPIEEYEIKIIAGSY